MSFVHLHTHSHYSLLDGLAKIDELIEHAKVLGMDTIALTDHGNLYGAIEFYKKAKKAGVKPILGVEAYLAPKHRTDRNSLTSDKYFHITLLAQNNIGWKNLLQLVTKANLEGFYYKPRVDKELLAQYSEGLIALSGCPSGEIPRMIARGQEQEAQQALKEYQSIFGKNFYIEVWHQPKLNDIKELLPKMISFARAHHMPIVATQDIHYLRKEDSFYHDVLLAVQTGNRVEEDDRFSLRDAELHMRSPQEMEEAFADYPEAIENTQKIADQCTVDIPLGETLLPHFTVPEGETSFSYLKKLINERIKKRFDVITPEIEERLLYELGVIEKMGFADYFLIVQDFVNWAKDRNIVVGPGRGSAAGSLVSYILRITDIDPLTYNLLFERFLNPDRIQMPDIDIDFTDVRRNEVLGYLKQTYGDDHVAQIITFGTMASRAAIRDSGRALGFSYSFCDQIAKLVPFNFSLEKTLEEVSDFKKQYQENSDVRRLVDAARHLEGVARHASVHACGTVISKEPLTTYMPLQYAPQDQGTIITQFEMQTVEDLGLLKMDLLGLKNLTIIENTIRLVHDIHATRIDVSAIPLDDQATFALLKKGDTTGVFQLESSGMRRYLKELKPTELEDIIAMVALYRPGPMELIPSYVARKYGKEPVTYLHPLLEPILKNTYGIGIYQEQMMRIARDLAGYTLAEADTLRKAIGKKIKELLDEQQTKLVQGMIAKGIDKSTAQKIWDLFPPFARYGFNRSHAVCYAMIAYQTAYLKAHFPVELMASLLNADSSDIDRVAFLVGEAKKMSIAVFPPDINQSYGSFIPEGENIRFGLEAIKNVGSAIVKTIVEDRQRKGPFVSFEDFLSRVLHKDLNKKSLESLIKTGVFDSMGMERKQLLENIDKIIGFSQYIRKTVASLQNNLFGGSSTHTKLDFKDVDPATNAEKLFWEKELLGFYVSDHPLRAYEQILATKRVTPIKTLLKNGRGPGLTGSVRIAGIVNDVKKIITKNKKQMAFAKIEDLGDTVEVIVFPDVLEKKPEVWEERSIIIVQGKLSDRDGEEKVICEEVVKLN